MLVDAECHDHYEFFEFPAASAAFSISLPKETQSPRPDIVCVLIVNASHGMLLCCIPVDVQRGVMCP